MSDLVNAVAKAICFLDPNTHNHWSGEDDDWHETYRDQARAAIEIMFDELIAEAGEMVVVSDRWDHVADGVDLADWLRDGKEADYD